MTKSYTTEYKTIFEGVREEYNYYHQEGAGDTLYWTVSSGSAKSGSDYNYTNGSVSVSSSRSVIKYSPFTTINDNIYEGSENFVLHEWDNDEDITIYYTINDEADKPRISVSSSYTVTEDDQDSTLQIGMTASNPAAFGYDLRIKSESGSAIAGLDFEAIDESVRMEAGQTFISKNIKIIGDRTNEVSESFKLNISSTFGSTTTTVNIKDNDPQPVPQDPRVTEPAAVTELVSEFKDAGKLAVAAKIIQPVQEFAQDLFAIDPGIGHPYYNYYYEAATNMPKINAYAQVLQTAGNIKTSWDIAQSVIDLGTTAYVEYQTTGELGKTTSFQSAQMSAALLSGALGEVTGEIAGKAFTAYAAGIAAGASFGVTGAALPILGGLVIGTAVTYGSGKLFSYIATQGVNYLYSGSSSIKTNSIIEPQSTSQSTPIIGQDGSVGNIKIGGKVPQAAWKYNSVTKEFSWFDESSKKTFNQLLSQTNPSDNSVINGSDAQYKTTDTLTGTSSADKITRVGSQRVILAGGGSDTINASGKTSVLIHAGTGNDTIVGGVSNIAANGSLIYGDEGNDTFVGQTAYGSHVFNTGDFERTYDILDGGEGVDLLDYSGTSDYSQSYFATLDPKTRWHLGFFAADLRNIVDGKYGQLQTIYFQPGVSDPTKGSSSMKKINNIENVIGPKEYRSMLMGNYSRNSLQADGNYSNIYGYGGDDTLISSGDYVQLYGGEGDDILKSFGNNNLLVGESGNDTAIVDFSLANAEIAWSFNGTIQNRSPFKESMIDNSNFILSNGDARTKFVNIEKIDFSDGSVNIVDDNALIDDLHYYNNNKDVWDAHADPADHYAAYGWREGRDPNALFSTSGYLAANPDVRAAGVDPLQHYDTYGWKEGRDPSAYFDNELYLAHNPDVMASGVNPLRHYLEHGRAEGRQIYTAVGKAADIGKHPGFDHEYYILFNYDVAAAALISGSDVQEFAYSHYLDHGWREGRNPNSIFIVGAASNPILGPIGYLGAYPDVAAAGIDPLGHYMQYGWKEGRDPSPWFDVAAYRFNNSDVAAAGIDPMTHYLQYGAHEGRLSFADGRFGVGPPA